MSFFKLVQRGMLSLYKLRANYILKERSLLLSIYLILGGLVELIALKP
jgi:hypothetical protein